jgi:hypothetical protein
MGLRLSRGLGRLLLAAAAPPIARLCHMLATIHPAIAVAVGAAIALLVMRRHLAVLIAAHLLVLIMALMLLLRRRSLRGGAGCDRQRDRGHENLHRLSPSNFELRSTLSGESRRRRIGFRANAREEEEPYRRRHRLGGRRRNEKRRRGGRHGGAGDRAIDRHAVAGVAVGHRLAGTMRRHHRLMVGPCLGEADPTEGRERQGEKHDQLDQSAVAHLAMICA